MRFCWNDPNDKLLERRTGGERTTQPYFTLRNPYALGLVHYRALSSPSSPETGLLAAGYGNARITSQTATSPGF